jgi:hypothetical protein
VANWWWVTPEGTAALAAATDTTNQNITLRAVAEAPQPTRRADILRACRLLGMRAKSVHPDGRPDGRDTFSENVSYYMTDLKKGGLLASKKSGPEGERRKRRESAKAAGSTRDRVLRAAVEPIAKDKLLTIVAAPMAENVVDALVADGTLIKFPTGKVMTARREDDEQ